VSDGGGEKGEGGADGPVGAPTSVGTRRGTWFTASFLSALGLGGGQADTAPAQTARSPVVARLAVLSGGEVQSVRLGLCNDCWGAALATNGQERVRRAGARRAMGDVE